MSKINGNGIPRGLSIKDIWVRFKESSSEVIVLRNALLEHYLPLVRYQAERIHVKLPHEVELDDLISAGTFGLLDAIMAFDLGRGIKFETYAAPRIRGAILDELRNMDWVPRLVRSRERKLLAAKETLFSVLGREPTKDEICARLKITSDDYDKITKDAHRVGTVSLSRKWFETDSNKDVREVDCIKDEKAASADRESDRVDLREFILRGLNSTARLVIRLLHFEGYKEHEAATLLFMSESRVSQIHKQAIEQLRSRRNLRNLCLAN